MQRQGPRIPTFYRQGISLLLLFGAVVAGAWWGIQITNLETEGGVPHAFSILCNHHHPTSDSDQVRAAQAAIVNALADLPLSMP